MSNVRMPLASLAQPHVDSNTIPKSTHGKNYPLGQVLYFHERRLVSLESKKEETEDTTAHDTALEILSKKVEHLEKLCQKLSQTLSQVKEQQNNVTLQVEEEEDDEEEN